VPKAVDVVPFRRAEMLDRLGREAFDVLVIGGGITGVGVALDAATRGLRAALVERHDFASGTSSKSSKLVHGGLRYLQQGDVRLVYEALRERHRLQRNAPHLVSVMPFMIPILNRDGMISPKIARALGSALWMYDLTGGWRIGKLHRRLNRERALAHMPTIRADRLASGYLYYDTAADDARLCLTVARTAAQHGAVVANRCNVVELTHAGNGNVDGAVVDTGEATVHVRAKVVVNAAGVWVDGVRALDEGADPESLRPAKGVHVTIPWDKVRNDIAVVIPVSKDKRSLFLIPWGPRPDGSFTHTYIGTTDTDYDGPLDDPQCTADDIAYVLRAVNASVTTGVAVDDVTGVWAGLRPLVRSADPNSRTADMSRRHHVAISQHGVVRVVGGKLTTYREMAEDAVDVVTEQLGHRTRCRTKRLRLLGAAKPTDPPGSRAAHLASRYGTLAEQIHELVRTDPSLGEALVPGLPYVRAEAVYAVRDEMAITLRDVVERRTRAHLLDRDATVAAASSIADLLAAELGWNAAETERQLADYLAAADRERDAGAPAPGAAAP
jgi:glycerol-3-phosphate dehydrogenase